MSDKSDATRLPVILLVEDSEDDVFFFRRALRQSEQPHHFFYAADGHQAMEFLSHKGAFERSDTSPKPDIIFLDLKLPKFTGFDILRWIRAEGLSREFRIVVLSGSDQETDRSLARELGAHDYVVKPLHPEYLRMALKSVSEN
jgi:DNA-binding response OmpR family regulator